MGARQDDFIKGICSPGSLGPNPGSIQLDSAALMLHSYQMERSSLTFQMLHTGKRNLYFSMGIEIKNIGIKTFFMLALGHFYIGSHPLL